MESIREWFSQIVCFLCLMTLLLYVIPDTGMKRYVRFFLGMLFLLVVVSPLGKLSGGTVFFESFEKRSLKGLQQELQKKIEEIYAAYHIPQQETHNNNQKTGVEDGEVGIHR